MALMFNVEKRYTHFPPEQKSPKTLSARDSESHVALKPKVEVSNCFRHPSLRSKTCEENIRETVALDF